MNAKAGVTTATVAWTATVPYLGDNWRTVVAGYGVSVVFSYLPDLDHDRSTAGQAVGRFAWLIRHVLGGHRMGTHAPVMVALAVLGASFFLAAPPLGTAAGVGYGAHLFTDWLTIQGIPWLWPLSRRRYSLARIRTGSIAEDRYVRIVGVLGYIIGLLDLYLLGAPAWIH